MKRNHIRTGARLLEVRVRAFDAESWALGSEIALPATVKGSTQEAQFMKGVWLVNLDVGHVRVRSAVFLGKQTEPP